MNVSNSTPSLSLAGSVSKAGPPRGLDVTVSDRGVDVRNTFRTTQASAQAASPPSQVAPSTTTASSAPTTQAAPTTQVASTQRLQQTLSAQEADAIADRFADLPRTPTAGLYGRAGREAVPPLAAHQGSLIDITG